MTTVTIWGPNLSGGGEALHVHAPGCADTKRGIYRYAEEPWTITVATLPELVEACYPASDFGYDAATEWQDYAGDIRVFPCVTGLEAGAR